jgi:hypothetical protein
MLILPLASTLIDLHYHDQADLIAIGGKWFVFWAVGVRLLIAGVRQATKPEFTLKDIFHIDNNESKVIVRELGFANACIGTAAVLSLFIPEWRAAAAFTGGAYMGLAGVEHIVKKAVSANEILAMISDLFIFLLMALYIYWSLLVK